jgi:hypothetical protein
MENTIRVNGVLMPEMPYSCHSDISPNKFKERTITHSKGNVSWPDPLSNYCCYDKLNADRRCKGCGHPKSEAEAEARA